MIILGIILLVVGYLLPLHLLFVLGGLLLVIGLVFAVLGGAGRPVAGRRYWF